MDAKAYLQSIRKADAMIAAMMRERDQIGDMRYRITQTLKPVMVSGGGEHGGFTAASDKMVDMENDIAKKIAGYIDLKREAGALLRRLENPQHYKVLHQHYLLFESFERIAVDMGYTYRNVCYLHGRALQAFQRVLDAQET